MADLFRKSSMDKFSSPDQLDRAITIVSPSFWIAAVGGGLIIVVALIWSVFGRLPLSVSANGIYMGDIGIYNAVAEADGFVEEVLVREGDDVEAGRDLVQLDDTLYTKQIEDLKARRDIVESVTFYSHDDPATADTKELLKIKAGSGRADSGSKSAREAEFNAEKGSILDQLDRGIRNQQSKADRLLFTARIGGRITNVNVSKGDAVKSGTTLFKIASVDKEQDDVVLYVPVENGRRIEEGMEAAVYPSTFNRQEYGHMNGKVEFVSDYTAASEDLMNELGDSALVKKFQQSGSVVRVTVRLERDPETASGYKWSSKKGGEVKLDEGTLVSADIVTETKAPVSMLIPYVKNRFSVMNDNGILQQDSEN